MYGEEIEYVEVPGGGTAGAVDRSLRGCELRRGYYEMASGLQAVDGLRVSAYMESLGQSYIGGNIGAPALSSAVHSYYAESSDRDAGEREADLVAARMIESLESTAFTFAPPMLSALHRQLFAGVLPDEWVGVFRSVNLTKPEDVLDGKSVTYGDWSNIGEMLAYDFSEEARVVRNWPFSEADVDSLARFVSSIWQVHPFREGNTRTVALFLQLYLRSMGISVDNNPFAARSRFFRDALVKSNYADIPNGINPDLKDLRSFIAELLGTCS